MTSPTLQSLLTIGVIALTTLLTRALTFVLFSSGNKTPKMVEYLGQVLPHAIIGMLVIYCFRYVSFITSPFGIGEVVAGVFVVIIHKWKHNLLLSIGGGTALYMVLVQMVL